MKLQTVKKYNYKMVIEKKTYVIPEVNLTISPFDGGLAMSVGEYRRIKKLLGIK